MPFKKATDDLLGINGNYFMITYGETKKNSAFKTYARAKDLPFDIANAISKKLSEYEKAVKHSDGAEVNIEEYITDPEQLRLLKESEVYQGIIDNISPKLSEYEKAVKHSDGAEVNIEEYITDPEQLRLLKESEVYQGIIDNISPSPCSHILLNQDIRREIGITKIKDVFVANITGKEADELKYLKND